MNPKFFPGRITLNPLETQVPQQNSIEEELNSFPAATLISMIGQLLTPGRRAERKSNAS